ncbi:MAG: hypothetical protein AAFV95_17890 [Bacteroidota bacterium]
MKQHTNNWVPFFLALVFALIAHQVTGQADPEWLKSWEEAEQAKPSTVRSVSRIASEEEPGVPFVIRAQLYHPDGKPAKDVLVHAYHRDVEGYDFGKNDSSFTIWRLQGWAKTDENGRFEFHSIRPAADHLGREGAHIHLTIVSRDYGRQWLPTVYLADDPAVTASQRQRSKEAEPFGWVCEPKESGGIQYLDAKMRLKQKGDF